MVALFAFEFIEGNTVTRLYFMRLRRLTREAATLGSVTPGLEQARKEHVPTFTHVLDIPLLLVVIWAQCARTIWFVFAVGVVAALATATILTIVLPRLYPWTPEVRP
jgi:hypothetical protein